MFRGRGRGALEAIVQSRACGRMFYTSRASIVAQQPEDRRQRGVGDKERACNCPSTLNNRPLRLRRSLFVVEDAKTLHCGRASLARRNPKSCPNLCLARLG